VWELSLGIYLVVKGFRSSPILADDLTEPGRRLGDGERAVPAARHTAENVGSAPPAERP
jgi:hypothetical protein